MAETPKVYALCSANCRWETMTREQIISAIAEATGVTVTDIDEAFITKLKELNNGTAVSIWVGTQAEYNNLVKNGLVEDGVIYFTEDGSKLTLLENTLNANTKKISEHETKITQHDTTLTEHEERLQTVEEASGTLDGTLPISKGGTGATTAAKARSNLGLGSVATKSTVPVSMGGTGATESSAALYALGVDVQTIYVTIRPSEYVTKENGHNLVVYFEGTKEVSSAKPAGVSSTYGQAFFLATVETSGLGFIPSVEVKTTDAYTGKAKVKVQAHMHFTGEGESSSATSLTCSVNVLCIWKAIYA